MNKENLTVYSFNHYLRFPFTLAKIFYNFCRKDGQPYLNKESFSEGMCKIFISKISPQKIEMIFHLYDLDNDGIIHKRDILFFLKYFHSVENEINIKQLYDLIDFALEGIESMNLNQWQYLNMKTNSDIFILTLFYIFIRKPFCEENIKFYMNNFFPLAILDQLQNEESNTNNKIEVEDKTLFYSLCDSSQKLFDYINSNFKESFEYLISDEEDNNSIDSLEDFDDAKNQLFNNEINETILSGGIKKDITHKLSQSDIAGKIPDDIFEANFGVSRKETNDLKIFNPKAFFTKKIGENLYKIEAKNATVFEEESEIKKKILGESLLSNEQFIKEDLNSKNKKISFCCEGGISNLPRKKAFRNSFSYFHGLRYEIEAYHDMNNKLTSSIKNLPKYKLIFLNDEIYMTTENQTEVFKIINLKHSFVTKNKEIIDHGKTYYTFQINSYDLNENEIQNFKTNISGVDEQSISFVNIPN
ncbi:MAG: hypothetical protein MJ252_10940, partial [archaeon]|nr:hypothetical protein [archaeon]